MALNMLISGADCGPLNPLQGLAKRFDQDRGIQQDQFVSGRAGPSRQTFRTTQAASPGLEEQATRFFAGDGSQSGNSTQSLGSRPLDLSMLQNALPVAGPSLPAHTLHTSSIHGQAPLVNWASDFMSITAQRGPAQVAKAVGLATETEAPQRMRASPSTVGMQWAPSLVPMHMPPRVISPLAQAHSPTSIALWDKEFQSHEASASSSDLRASQIPTSTTEEKIQLRHDADDLARTAAELIETVKDEQNPKFKNSQFLQLMKSLRDGDIVVDGNDMVQRSEANSSVDPASLDKGKGRMQTMPNVPAVYADPGTSVGQKSRQNSQSDAEVEDSIDAYFRQHNEDYINYWNDVSQGLQNSHLRSNTIPRDSNDWGALQNSWDAFEASTWGVKPVPRYEFQPQNPYMRDEAGQDTQNHSMHSDRSIYDSVLELEAEAQRNKDSAMVWYNLGVKQQENEREPKAIAALTRALALDDTHLPSWLALAISHTNEGSRGAADDAVEQWVRRNEQYAPIMRDFFERVEKLNGGTLDSLNQARRHDELVHCLMAMARSGNGTVDADVQVALAVLLNASEDYLKAQDCFKAALSVRPDDWQLYNRVGATLANSGFSQEALDYYYRALELNPAYIRARYNLGISCMNMKRYREAAEFILDALVMQESDASIHGTDDKRGITSAALWDSLRTSMLHLNEVDLAMVCDREDIDEFRRLFHKQ